MVSKAGLQLQLVCMIPEKRGRERETTTTATMSKAVLAYNDINFLFRWIEMLHGSVSNVTIKRTVAGRNRALIVANKI